MSNYLVPIGIVAFELGWGTKELLARCNGGIVRDQCGGRCISSTLYAELIMQRDASLAASAEMKARNDARAREESARHEAEVKGMRHRLQVRAEVQAPAVAAGVPALALTTQDAQEERWEFAAADAAEMRGGNMTYHPIERT